MDSVVKTRMGSFNDKSFKGLSLNEIVFSILMAQSINAERKNMLDIVQIQNAIKFAIERKEPINLSFVWTVCGHARTKYKVLDWHINLPRIADLWALYWIKSLNDKVKLFYPPGLKVVIIDEVPLARIGGWSDEDMRIRKSIMQNILPKQSGIEFADLPNFELNGLDPGFETQQVLTILSSTDILDEETQAMVATDLYLKRDKDWEYIKSCVGHKWDQAIDIVRQMNGINAVRKEVNWIGGLFDNQPFIDGCIVRKGRWCPKIWVNAFPYHGGGLVDNANGALPGDPPFGRFEVEVVPEARLIDVARPFKVPISDFQKYCDFPIPWEGDVTLFWQK